MPEIYMIIARKIFLQIFFGGIVNLTDDWFEFEYAFLSAICIKWYAVAYFYTHSFASQDCRRAHPKNPRCNTTLVGRLPGPTGGAYSASPDPLAGGRSLPPHP